MRFFLSFGGLFGANVPIVPLAAHQFRLSRQVGQQSVFSWSQAYDGFGHRDFAEEPTLKQALASSRCTGGLIR